MMQTPLCMWMLLNAKTSVRVHILCCNHLAYIPPTFGQVLVSSELKMDDKKRLIPDDSSELVDHRKRRRNRTTQSCLNCHTSKRMCDRGRYGFKLILGNQMTNIRLAVRPCSRCRQLGLVSCSVFNVRRPLTNTNLFCP